MILSRYIHLVLPNFSSVFFEDKSYDSNLPSQFVIVPWHFGKYIILEQEKSNEYTHSGSCKLNASNTYIDLNYDCENN